MTTTPLRLTPTVFFTRAADGALRQRAHLHLAHSSAAEALEVEVQAGAFRERQALGEVKPGEGDYPLELPDVAEPTPLTLTLYAGAEARGALEVTWQPARHWQLDLVHGSHHDLGYTDIPSNVLREHAGHLDNVLAYAEETAGWPAEARFHYTIEEAWSALYFAEHRPPSAVEQLARLMRAGQVELTALFANETAELCSPEELVRALYPAQRFARRNGVPLRTAELNDIPGVPWGLLQVLAGAGIRYFSPGIQDYFNWWFRVHPMWDEATVLPRDLPGAFWWETPAAQRVLAWYPGGAIESLYLWDYPQTERDVAAYLERIAGQGYPHTRLRMKVLGGRRDNAPPDLRFSRFVREWNARWAYPRLRLTTNADFFERFEAEAGANLPVLRGELNATDYPVAATSRARELGLNRLTHGTLAAAERLAVFAGVAAPAIPYPASPLAEAYDCALLSDEHTGGMDLPLGPAQEACWDQKGEYAFRAAALAQDVLLKSLNTLADQVRLEAAGYHVAVFNSLPFARSDVVRAPAAPIPPSGRPMYWAHPADGPAHMTFGSAHGRNLVSLPAELLEAPFDLVDVSTGQRVPYQVVRLASPHAPEPWAAGRWALGQVDLPWTKPLQKDRAQLLELVFVAEAVPAGGYKLFQIVPAASEAPPATDLQVGDHWLENRYYRVTLDPHTGVVTSLYDKELGKEWVDAAAPHALHQLVVREAGTGEAHPPASSRISVVARGPLVATLLAEGDAPGCPRRAQSVTLYAGVKRVDFATRLLKDAMPMLELYLAFPFALSRPQFAYEAGAGVLRPITDQLPGSSTDAYTAQSWAAAWDVEGGVTWTSREAPVVEFGGLWPGYVSQAHHGATPPGYGHPVLTQPEQFERGHLYSYLAVNNFRTNFEPYQVADLLFRYSLTTHAGDWQAANAPRFGAAAHLPLEPVFLHGPQAGPYPAAAAFCDLDQPHVQLLTLKAAEDGDGTILRLLETAGRATIVRVSLPTLTITSAHACDLVETDGAPLPAEPHAVSVPLPAHGHATVRLRGSRWPVLDWLARL